MLDVLVIGAGLSGLLTATRLLERGVSVRLIEARDRTGGRLLSTPEGLDLGASWVWDSEHHIHALLRELQIPTFDHHREGVDVYDDGHTLQRGRFPRSHVPERRVKGGTRALTDALAARCAPAITLSCPATALRLDGDAVIVETPQGPLRAAKVVAALPPALLAQRIALPDLAEPILARLRRVPTWMASVAKVVAVYDDRFWQRAGLSGRAATRRGPLTEIHDLSGPDGTPAALFGFAHRALLDPHWRDALRPQLAHLFGPEAALPKALHVAAWWEEPWTHTEGGDDRAYGAPWLREPLMDGLLHLVSTETSGVSPGHLDGAVERAEAVAAFLAS